MCDYSTFSFVNGIFETQELNRSLEPCFLLRAVLDLLWHDICFYKLFLINKIKNTGYPNNDYTNVIKFVKIRHITDKKHKRRKTKNSFPKKSVENPPCITRIEQNNDLIRIMHEIKFRSSFKQLTFARLLSLNFSNKSPWCSPVPLNFDSYNLHHCKKNCCKLDFLAFTQQLL